MKKIIIAGIGPGSREDITPAVVEAVATADVVVGYKYYFQFITPYIKNGCTSQTQAAPYRRCLHRPTR